MPHRRAATAFALAAVGLVLAAPAGPAAPVPADPTAAARQMEALWADLEKGDADASRALLKLADRPKETVAFLREKLPPLRVSAERVRELLADLGSDKKETWTRASETLEYFDPRLAISLVDLMAEVADEPARPRLVAVLSGRPDYGASLLAIPKQKRRPIPLKKYNDDNYQFNTQQGDWRVDNKVEALNVGPIGNSKRKWTRASRAIVLLEHIGTPDALDVLKAVAAGHPDAAPTKEAKAAVERLTAKPR